MRVIEKETSRPPLLREVEVVNDQLKTNERRTVVRLKKSDQETNDGEQTTDKRSALGDGG